MLRGLLFFVYRFTPKALIDLGRRLPYVYSLRRLLFLRGIPTVEVWAVSPFTDSKFRFTADLRTALKVRTRPIEGTLLRRSFEFLAARASLPNNSIVIDVGASFGYMSLVWAQTIAQHGRVYAFEVNDFAFKLLSLNIQQNFMQNRIHAVKQPVFSATVELRLYDGPTASRADPELGNLKSSLAISIDDFVKNNQIGKLDLLKVDVDGLEYEILKGAARSIEVFRPLIFVEHNRDGRIVEFLHERGYVLFELDLTPFEYKGSNLIARKNE